MLFCINTRITPGPISQVLPGRWVRHSQYSKKLFVRHIWKGINCLRRMSYTTTLFWNTETFEETKMTVASGLSRYTSDHVYVCKKKIFPKLHWKPHTSVYLIHSHMSTLKNKIPQVSSIGRLLFNRLVDLSRSISTDDANSPTWKYGRYRMDRRFQTKIGRNRPSM